MHISFDIYLPTITSTITFVDYEYYVCIFCILLLLLDRVYSVYTTYESILSFVKCPNMYNVNF